MKIILTVTGPVAVEDAEKIIADWRDENAGYYGQPHGVRCILRDLEVAPCGHSRAQVPVVPRGSVVYSEPGHRWLTCGGNDHRLAMTAGGVVLAYSGRRHGMRPEFREFLETYWGETQDGGEPSPRVYQTTRPDLLPWQTAT